MLRRGLLGLALVVGSLVPSAAQAQVGFGVGIGFGGWRGGGVGFGYGGYPGYYGGYPGYYGGYPGYYGGSGVYVRPAYYRAYGPTYVQPAYVQPAGFVQPAVAGPQPVYVNVQVPANAEVWIDGAKTSQTGPVRRFVSPPLTPGQAYTYELTASWMKDGKPVSEKRTVNFSAGQQNEVNVDLRPAS